ncbi:MAG: type II toxin-antitoxin system YafQ family toxin [Candidatus Marinimicrobia bacterium]|nr:type II toxin-antitoxin system YafQ family toxin [Candidatus Neomarinimicrobiota bacterium]
MKELYISNAYKKDIKRLVKQGRKLSEIDKIIHLLVSGERFPPKHRLHKLKGKWSGYRECHIAPDWLLIWREDEQSVRLMRTGSHSDMFR